MELDVYALGNALMDVQVQVDDSLLAESFCEKGLTDGVVDLVRTGVVQIFALDVNLSSAKLFGNILGVVHRRRSTDVVS